MSTAWERAERIVKGGKEIVAMPPVKEPARTLEGVLYTAGHGNDMGLYLHNDDDFVPLDIPADWQGKRVQITVRLLDD